MVLAPSINDNRSSAPRNNGNGTAPRIRRQSGISDFFAKSKPTSVVQHHRHPSESSSTRLHTATMQQRQRREREPSFRGPSLHVRQQSTNNNISMTASGKQIDHRTRVKRESTPVGASNVLSPVQENKILSGVVACLDVRTDDGDDVSLNFERALHSMGAKTRRTFSDSVTHLVYKNGSAATLKKAMSKDVFIVNLLWVSRCKREGKRLPEADFLIEKPQGLVLTGTKKRKSMEPGKVKPLNDVEPTPSTSSDGSVDDGLITERIEDLEPRRRTIATTSWRVKDFKRSNESELRKREIAALASDEEDEKERLAPARFSLPASVESIADRHSYKRPKPAPASDTVIPVHPPSVQMKEQIKARFSIGQARDSNPDDSSKADLDASRLSLNSPPISNVSTPIKRKRRLTGSLPKPLAHNITTSTKTHTDIGTVNNNDSKTNSNSTNVHLIPQFKI
ncbi:hypothetical protein BDF20DRAFT_175362 [Mycotypha africana]|uniref:uncharacterized protein n=1 Tax=Mycotypha africana TaxID=64632 RepID=UPI0023013D61|nr:uncharacterized protein BDF20DRAFT_175362 [Mycotypha africana]KAI8968341.1 hypothetical protein BDF20DRAFT_175362 [Mycotypha africana]